MRRVLAAAAILGILTSPSLAAGCDGVFGANYVCGSTAGGLPKAIPFLNFPIPVTSVFSRTGAVTAQTGDYSVSQVTGAAPLASPTFTGTPAAPTPGSNVNTTQIPTTAWVNAWYAPLASPALTGTPTAPTATTGTNTTQIATTAFVVNTVGSGSNATSVADYTALRGVNTSSYQSVFVRDATRTGWFRWDSSDLSATLIPHTGTSTVVNTSTGTITSASHGLQTGDPVYSNTSVDGLTANTFYYVILVDANNFKLATTSANAYGSSAVTLTATTNFTWKEHADPLSGIYVIPTGLDISGSQGAWVRQYQTWPTIKNFGAVGDGTTDNTETLNIGLDSIRLLKVGGLYAPSGTYLTGKINWPGNNIALVGQSSGYAYTSVATINTTFKAKTGTTTLLSLYQTNSAVQTDREGNLVQGVKIDCAGIASYGIETVLDNALDLFRITGCTSAGLHFPDYANSNRITRFSIWNNSGYGVLYEGASSTTSNFDGGVIESNSLAGMVFYGGAQVSVSNTVIESNGNQGIIIYRPNTNTNAFQGFKFTNVWLEGNNTAVGDLYAVEVSAQTADEAHAPTDIEFNHSHISSASANKWVEILAGDGIKFKDTVFSGSTQSDALSANPAAYRVSFINSNTANTGPAGYGGVSATQMDNMMGTCLMCWWWDPAQKREVGGSSPAAAFQNSWVNYAAGSMPLQYWFTQSGEIRIEGCVKSGTIPAAVFTLPLGYRPDTTIYFPVAANAAYGEGHIDSSGNVAIDTGSATRTCLNITTARWESPH